MPALQEGGEEHMWCLEMNLSLTHPRERTAEAPLHTAAVFLRAEGSSSTLRLPAVGLPKMAKHRPWSPPPSEPAPSFLSGLQLS